MYTLFHDCVCTYVCKQVSLALALFPCTAHQCFQQAFLKLCTILMCITILTNGYYAILLVNLVSPLSQLRDSPNCLIAVKLSFRLVATGWQWSSIPCPASILMSSLTVSQNESSRACRSEFTCVCPYNRCRHYRLKNHYTYIYTIHYIQYIPTYIHTVHSTVYCTCTYCVQRYSRALMHLYCTIVSKYYIVHNTQNVQYMRLWTNKKDASKLIVIQVILCHTVFDSQ